jgi:hypothetical protein
LEYSPTHTNECAKMIPCAPLGIRDGAVEEGLIAPIAFSLPSKFTLLLVPEIDALRIAKVVTGMPIWFWTLISAARSLKMSRRLLNCGRTITTIPY